MAHDVFISHSSKDKVIADALCATFEKDGIRCWVAPRDVPPGANWGAAIIDAIAGSRIMVLVFSGNANASGQIAREVECAASQGVTIVPVRVENVVPAKELQFFLSNIHWLDALTPPMERHLEEINAKIKPMLEQAGETSARKAPPVSPPPRVSQRKWWPFATAAAVLVLLLVAVAVWKPWKRSQLSTTAQPSTNLDPALIGRWTYTVNFFDSEVRIDFTLDAAGRYTLRRTLETDGSVTDGKDGTANVIDNKRKQFPIKATYNFISDDELLWSIPISASVPDLRTSVNYKRAGGPRSSENRLVGRWKANTFLYNLTWDAVWDVAQDSTYHVIFDNLDEGAFTAAAGKWEAKSALGRPTETGTYRNVTPDSFDMSDRFFQVLKFDRAAKPPAK
jgi:hypothetical protein